MSSAMITTMLGGAARPPGATWACTRPPGVVESEAASTATTSSELRMMEGTRMWRRVAAGISLPEGGSMHEVRASPHWVWSSHGDPDEQRTPHHRVRRGGSHRLAGRRGACDREAHPPPDTLLAATG